MKYSLLSQKFLSHEIIIDEGDGIEDVEEYHKLLQSLFDQLNPKNIIEEMVVEKIAVSYWRMCRCAKFEKSTLRKRLDHLESNYYQNNHEHSSSSLAPELLDDKIRDLKDAIKFARKEKKDLVKLREAGSRLESTFDDHKEAWEELHQQTDQLSVHEKKPKEILKYYRNIASDEDIWHLLSGMYDESIRKYKGQVQEFEKQGRIDTMHLEVEQGLNVLPHSESLERLMEYEKFATEQFYRALKEWRELRGDDSQINI